MPDATLSVSIPAVKPVAGRGTQAIHLAGKLLLSASDCITITATSDHILYVNEAFLRTYEYPGKRADRTTHRHGALGSSLDLCALAARERSAMHSPAR
jgi:hypothetical protein